jgi:hypothetical protein
MNLFKNIFKHPRTSAAGMLISIATVSGVLAQQGVTFGAVGGGTVVSLAGALATALLGLIAHDPGAPAAQPVPASDCGGTCSGECKSKSNATAKLSAWLLIMLLLPLPWLEGCNAKDVAKEIVNWTPSLQSAIATVDSTAILLAPEDEPIFAAATADFDAAANLLTTQARAYLVNPTANALAQLQNQVVAFQQQVNSALLKAARIFDAASQRHAMTAIQAVATIVTAILSLVQSISSKAEVAQMAAMSPIKFTDIEPFINQDQSVRIVATHYKEEVATARLQIAESRQLAINAGF